MCLTKFNKVNCFVNSMTVNTFIELSISRLQNFQLNKNFALIETRI